MKLEEVIPLKHILVTRSGGTFWYIGDEIGKSPVPYHGDLYSLNGSKHSGTYLKEIYEDNLLAKRDDIG